MERPPPARGPIVDLAHPAQTGPRRPRRPRHYAVRRRSRLGPLRPCAWSTIPRGGSASARAAVRRRSRRRCPRADAPTASAIIAACRCNRRGGARERTASRAVPPGRAHPPVGGHAPAMRSEVRPPCASAVASWPVCAPASWRRWLLDRCGQVAPVARGHALAGGRQRLSRRREVAAFPHRERGKGKREGPRPRGPRARTAG